MQVNHLLRGNLIGVSFRRASSSSSSFVKHHLALTSQLDFATTTTPISKPKLLPNFSPNFPKQNGLTHFTGFTTIKRYNSTSSIEHPQFKGPLHLYNYYVATGKFREDKKQKITAEILQKVHDELHSRVGNIFFFFLFFEKKIVSIVE